MANGDILYRRNDCLQVTFLSGATATDNGQWVDVAGYSEGNVHVAGITTATVQIRGYNLGSTLPANSVQGFQILSNITATADSGTGISLGAMPRYLKVIVSGYTGGTISAAAIVRNFHA